MGQQKWNKDKRRDGCFFFRLEPRKKGCIHNRRGPLGEESERLSEFNSVNGNFCTSTVVGKTCLGSVFQREAEMVKKDWVCCLTQ